MRLIDVVHKLLSLMERTRRGRGMKLREDSVLFARGNLRFKVTGYRNMKNRERLIEAICEAYDNPSYRPKRDNPETPQNEAVTYCNMACAQIAGAMGCNDLQGKLANQIADMMAASADWCPVPMTQAQPLANQGSLVFAIAKAAPHGHVVVIRPGIEDFSAKWNTRAPACMNIGKDCFISKGVNWAFQAPPSFYAWKRSL